MFFNTHNLSTVHPGPDTKLSSVLQLSQDKDSKPWVEDLQKMLQQDNIIDLSHVEHFWQYKDVVLPKGRQVGVKQNRCFIILASTIISNLPQEKITLVSLATNTIVRNTGSDKELVSLWSDFYTVNHIVIIDLFWSDNIGVGIKHI